MNKAIILIAGSGTRMSLETSKQLYLYQGKPLFYYPLKVFNDNPNIDEIILVVKHDELDKICSYLDKFNFKKVKDITVGGETRAESVSHGLKYINGNDIVLIHDGLRVFINNEIINANIEECKKYNAVVTAVKETNSLSIVNNNGVSSLMDREKVYIHQTPQTFLGSIIKKSYLDGNPFTDDASLVASKGFDVHIVNGSYDNIKITTNSDLTNLVKLG